MHPLQRRLHRGVSSSPTTCSVRESVELIGQSINQSIKQTMGRKAQEAGREGRSAISARGLGAGGGRISPFGGWL